MISLAGRDILHAWGKFVFTGLLQVRPPSSLRA